MEKTPLDRLLASAEIITDLATIGLVITVIIVGANWLIDWIAV